MGKIVDCYYPGREFPTISTTGRSCALNCKHCGRRYLESMIPLTEAEELLSFAHDLADKGGEGLLLSGGSDHQGRVSLLRFTEAINEISATTSLKVNAHVGLTPRHELEKLVDAGVSVFSTDIYGDDSTVREVLGLHAHASDYLQVVRDLRSLGAKAIAPHVCVGIHAGKIGAETSAIASLTSLDPEALVLISMIPTRGTAYESVQAPDGKDVVSVVATARELLPDTRLLLGCMRSKRDRSWELPAIQAGLDGIVLPAGDTLRRLEAAGIETRSKKTCCAVP